MREKFNLINDLNQRKQELMDNDQMRSLVGQGDFAGANSVMRATMNIKHHTQALTIQDPEFPMIFDGKENLAGKHSSFYTKVDDDYEVIGIVKKYNELLKGKCNIALYFLHNKKHNKYTVVERNEVEDLTENFGFSYKNDYIDQCEVGDVIPKDTIVSSSTSYDEHGNVSAGVNGRIAYGIHPAVQDDAIYCSESFAKKAMHNSIITKTIPINENAMLLNTYGDSENYQGMPNIGDTVDNGILMVTRNIKENRMFSELRDSSLSTINEQSDSIYYGDGEVIDITVYCNNKHIKHNKVNAQLVQYYNDARWFYTDVYKMCNKIIKNTDATIDKEINRWAKRSMDYLDTDAYWAFNDNIFTNIMVEITLRQKLDIMIGRKITGRHGNKTVVCNIVPDEEMPYLVTSTKKDEYGVHHPVGVKERVDLVTNPLAIINRTIPMALYEGSITFIIDKVRKHMNTMNNDADKFEFMIDVISMFNKSQANEMTDIYNKLSDRDKRKFIESSIAIGHDGLLKTNEGIYIRWEAFDKDLVLRDSIINVYKKYGDIIKPYHVFTPKLNWGRDIYIGESHIGYHYMLVLKQSGERGFSVRSAGSISDESLPEKGNENKIGKSWHSTTPIRFGEYETPNFMIITNPEDYALVTALYRTSIDGRRFMYEAILSEDGEYDIPKEFTSRSAQVLEVYLKSLGIRMETIIDESEYIGEEGYDDTVHMYQFKNAIIMATVNEMYYIRKLQKIYKRYLKENPNQIDDIGDIWDYIYNNSSITRKKLTDNIITLFNNNLTVLR